MKKKFIGLNIIVQQLPRPWGGLLSALLALIAVGAFGYVLIFGQSSDFVSSWTGGTAEVQVDEIAFSASGVDTAEIEIDFGAPIRFLSYGVQFSLADGVLMESASHWYEGFQGQFIGFVMLMLLGLVCFGLARLGARWMLQAEAATPGGAGGDDTGVTER